MTTTNFSIERVRLLCRAELKTHHRSLIGLLGLLFIFTAVLPRVPWLLGLSDSWSVSSPDEYNLGQDLALVLIFSTLSFLWYLNRKIFYPTPMSYATTPARLSEKAATFGIVFLTLVILQHMVVIVSFLVDAVMIADLPLSILWRDYSEMFLEVQGMGELFSGYALEASVSLSLVLMTILFGIFCAMHVRHFLLGLFFACLSLIVQAWLLMLADVGSDYTGKMVLVLLVALGAVGFLAHRIYHRLATAPY